MEDLYSVKLGGLTQEFRLEVLRGGAGYEDVSIRTEDVNRSGLQLAEFSDYFGAKRLRVIGRVETTYLEGLTSEEQRENFKLLLSQDILALIISREVEPFPECMEMAEEYNRTILHNPDATSVLMSNIIAALKSYPAPRITRHDVPVEVYDESVLLLDESGVDKSKTAIELVRHSHRLIADGAMEVKRNVIDRLVGTTPELIRHYIELRGIGVIDICHLFGMSAVKDGAEIDMVINLEQWKDGAIYDRLGLENLYTMILDVQIPSLTMPMRPDRDLVVIIEVAAINNRHKKIGYNATVGFAKQISQHFDQAMSAQLNDN